MIALTLLSMLIYLVDSVCYPYAAIEYDFTLPTGLDGVVIYGPVANT